MFSAASSSWILRTVSMAASWSGNRGPGATLKNGTLGLLKRDRNRVLEYCSGEALLVVANTLSRVSADGNFR